MQTYSVAPGVKLFHLPFDHFKTVSIRLSFHQPLTAETATVNALLVEVLLRGSKTLPKTLELNRYLEELYGATIGGYVAKAGNDHQLSFSASCIADEFVPEEGSLTEKTARVLHDLVFDPLLINGNFSEEYIRQEQKSLKESLLARINDKRSYALDRCTEEMFEGDTYAVSGGGDPDLVDGITAADLMTAYRRMLNSPVTIFVTGRADIRPLIDLFSNLHPEDRPYPVGDLFAPRKDVKEVTERMDVAQGKLVMGFTTGIGAKDPRSVALTVANSVFGAGAHSKLFKNVREKLSLAYYAYSRTDRYKGVMMVSAGIEFEQFEAARDEIMVQLAAMQEGKVSEEELFSAKQAMIGALRGLRDNPAQYVAWVHGNVLTDTLTDIDERIAKIEAVTAAEVVEAFRDVRLQTVYFLAGKEA